MTPAQDAQARRQSAWTDPRYSVLVTTDGEYLAVVTHGERSPFDQETSR